MDRREFMTRVGGAAAAGLAGSLTLSEKAEAVEARLVEELDRIHLPPKLCGIGEEEDGFPFPPEWKGKKMMMGDDPRLPPMPEKPTLIDFFRQRFAPASHLLQSANLALEDGQDESVIMACLLHDISIFGLLRVDHGYWGAQLIEPYVDEEVSWAIRYHQALRFYPDESVDYDYPEAYVKFFGEDYEPEPYIREAYEYARNHRWYMTARMITVNDVYAFDPNAKVDLERFTDIIGRNFKQPEEGLGFDNSPVAHMWRSIIWPSNFL